jgi:hypothetical protein
MADMAGIDTVRGIAYQQAQAVLEAVFVLENREVSALRVEGVADILDLEILDERSTLIAGKQFKVRAPAYTWGRSDLKRLAARWAAVPSTAGARFEFVTDGELGPSALAVEAAIEAAKQGELAELAQLLDVAETDPQVARAARMTVVRDRSNVGALLSRAEQQVMALLPGALTGQELRETARNAVSQLFILLMERASQADSRRRIITRSEIAHSLGIDPEQDSNQQWPGALRDKYITAALQLPTVAAVPGSSPSLQWAPEEIDITVQDGDVKLALTTLLDYTPTLLSGPTGEGKTTAIRRLTRTAASTGRVVLMARAEGYLPNRLNALAADAIAHLIDSPVPARIGTQALGDPTVCLVIDGVSEIPDALRLDLEENLRALVTASTAAAVILVGRDAAKLRAVLPASREPRRLSVSPLAAAARQKIAEVAVADAESHDERDAKLIVIQAESALQEAARNPLIFEMAARAISRGHSFRDRSGLYEVFIAQLAERSGATDIALTKRVLGKVFAALLDQGRRYADEYEWNELVAAAAYQLGGTPETVIRAGSRSGLFVADGPLPIILPLHDSFADYLAGYALAVGGVQLPERLSAGDEERLFFKAQIGGVSHSMATLLVRDLPFLAVRLAPYDERTLEAESPREVADLFELLTPGSPKRQVGLWRSDGRVTAFSMEVGTTTWLDDREAEIERKVSPHVVVKGGPLDAAVKLWRMHLDTVLDIPDTLPPRRPRSVEEAIDAIQKYHASLAAAFENVLSVIPIAGHEVIQDAVGPLGIRARVGQQAQSWVGPYIPVAYQRSEAVSVEAGDTDPDDYAWGRTDAEHFVQANPEAAAARKIIEAVNKIVGTSWL